MTYLPRIGITTSYEDGKQTLSHLYIQAIERAGGLPIPVPMLSDSATARSLHPVVGWANDDRLPASLMG
jgi:gamma-glutamyl-gamma-aminobutyrate hydrolase PuuD